MRLLRAGPGSPWITGKDARLLALLALPCAFLAFPALRGRTFFWGDLSYLHHPWKELTAQLLQAGTLPLWDPFAYFGMPLAGQMQSAVWYPLSLPFYLFSFPSALTLFFLLHFWLAGALSFLWLRRTGLTRAAAWGGAAAYMLCGLLVGHLPFLNHVSVLALLPALLLFGDRVLPLSLALSASFLAGYPPYLAGCAVAAAMLSAAAAPAGAPQTRLKDRIARVLRTWLAAGALAALLSGLLLLPGLELAAASRRAGGIDALEALSWSFHARDFLQFTAPSLIGKGFSPLSAWWKTCYWGFGGAALAVLGVSAFTLPAAGAALLYLAGTALLIGGGSNPASAWLWTHLSPLAYIRYPGNLAFLAAPVLMLLIGAALHRRRWAPLAAVAIAAELFFYAAGSQPTAPRSHFTDAGPLVHVLRRELGTHRYLLSPLALNWTHGGGEDADAASADLRHRLYGLANMPYRLPAAGNFGEPLVPEPSYELMDFLYSRPGLDSVAPWLGWADIRLVLTRDRKAPGELEYLGDSLWHLYGRPGPTSRAFWFDEKEGAAIPRRFGDPAPPLTHALPLKPDGGLDSIDIRASAGMPGWLYLAQPLGPGWKVRLLSEGGSKEAAPERAMTAFWKMRVPEGSWTAYFYYDPLSWRLGLLMTLSGLLLFCFLGMRRLLQGPGSRP